MLEIVIVELFNTKQTCCNVQVINEIANREHNDLLSEQYYHIQLVCIYLIYPRFLILNKTCL